MIFTGFFFTEVRFLAYNKEKIKLAQNMFYKKFAMKRFSINNFKNQIKSTQTNTIQVNPVSSLKISFDCLKYQNTLSYGILNHSKKRTDKFVKNQSNALTQLNSLVFKNQKALNHLNQNKKEQIFWNLCFDKGRLKNFVFWCFQNYGQKKTVTLLENLKSIGFAYATKAGMSLSIDDLQIPPTKANLLAQAEINQRFYFLQYKKGQITGLEYFQSLLDTWHRTSEILKDHMIEHFKSTDLLNPIYMMAFSGARGNISQVRQLVGMRGLMADPQGRIIEFPIRSNFREGLTLTEYMISCYGARKGVVDTALRTANAGYLTRRLVDVAQHVMICQMDCGTDKGIFISEIKQANQTLFSLSQRLMGRVLATDVYCTQKKNNQPNQHLIGMRNQEVTANVGIELAKSYNKILIRSSLTCQTTNLVCQFCYGWSLAEGQLVSIGEAVGILAAQSIGEPGTQLTMRTFHTGGVFDGEMIDQLVASYDGYIYYDFSIPGTLIRNVQGKIAFLTKITSEFWLKSHSKDAKILEKNVESKNYKIPAYSVLFIRNGEKVNKGQLIAEFSFFGKLGKNMKYGQYTQYNISSFVEGEIYSAYADISEKRSLYKDSIIQSLDWGYVWILSAKIFSLPFSSNLLTLAGDNVTTNTVVCQTKWLTDKNYLLDLNMIKTNKHDFLDTSFSFIALSHNTTLKVNGQTKTNNGKIINDDKILNGSNISYNDQKMFIMGTKKKDFLIFSHKFKHVLKTQILQSFCLPLLQHPEFFLVTKKNKILLKIKKTDQRKTKIKVSFYKVDPMLQKQKIKTKDPFFNDQIQTTNQITDKNLCFFNSFNTIFTKTPFNGLFANHKYDEKSILQIQKHCQKCNDQKMIQSLKLTTLQHPGLFFRSTFQFQKPVVWSTQLTQNVFNWFFNYKNKKHIKKKIQSNIDDNMIMKYFLNKQNENLNNNKITDYHIKHNDSKTTDFFQSQKTSLNINYFLILLLKGTKSFFIWSHINQDGFNHMNKKTLGLAKKTHDLWLLKKKKRFEKMSFCDHLTAVLSVFLTKNLSMIQFFERKVQVRAALSKKWYFNKKTKLVVKNKKNDHFFENQIMHIKKSTKKNFKLNSIWFVSSNLSFFVFDLVKKKVSWKIKKTKKTKHKNHFLLTIHYSLNVFFVFLQNILKLTTNHNENQFKKSIYYSISNKNLKNTPQIKMKQVFDLNDFKQVFPATLTVEPLTIASNNDSKFVSLVKTKLQKVQQTIKKTKLQVKNHKNEAMNQPFFKESPIGQKSLQKDITRMPYNTLNQIQNSKILNNFVEVHTPIVLFDINVMFYKKKGYFLFLLQFQDKKTAFFLCNYIWLEKNAKKKNQNLFLLQYNNNIQTKSWFIKVAFWLLTGNKHTENKESQLNQTNKTIQSDLKKQSQYLNKRFFFIQWIMSNSFFTKIKFYTPYITNAIEKKIDFVCYLALVRKKNFLIEQHINHGLIQKTTQKELFFMPSSLKACFQTTKIKNSFGDFSLNHDLTDHKSLVTSFLTNSLEKRRFLFTNQMNLINKQKQMKNELLIFQKPLDLIKFLQWFPLTCQSKIGGLVFFETYNYQAKKTFNKIEKKADHKKLFSVFYIVQQNFSIPRFFVINGNNKYMEKVESKNKNDAKIKAQDINNFSINGFYIINFQCMKKYKSFNIKGFIQLFQYRETVLHQHEKLPVDSLFEKQTKIEKKEKEKKQKEKTNFIKKKLVWKNIATFVNQSNFQLVENKKHTECNKFNNFFLSSKKLLSTLRKIIDCNSFNIYKQMMLVPFIDHKVSLKFNTFSWYYKTTENQKQILKPKAPFLYQKTQNKVLLSFKYAKINAIFFKNFCYLLKKKDKNIAIQPQFNHYRMTIKTGWPLFFNNLNCIVPTYKKIFQPGQVVLNHLCFNSHMIYMDIFFSLSFFHNKINTQTLTKKINFSEKTKQAHFCFLTQIDNLKYRLFKTKKILWIYNMEKKRYNFSKPNHFKLQQEKFFFEGFLLIRKVQQNPTISISNKQYKKKIFQSFVKTNQLQNPFLTLKQKKCFFVSSKLKDHSFDFEDFNNKQKPNANLIPHFVNMDFHIQCDLNPRFNIKVLKKVFIEKKRLINYSETFNYHNVTIKENSFQPELDVKYLKHNDLSNHYNMSIKSNFNVIKKAKSLFNFKKTVLPVSPIFFCWKTLSFIHIVLFMHIVNEKIFNSKSTSIDNLTKTSSVQKNKNLLPLSKVFELPFFSAHYYLNYQQRCPLGAISLFSNWLWLSQTLNYLISKTDQMKKADQWLPFPFSFSKNDQLIKKENKKTTFKKSHLNANFFALHNKQVEILEKTLPIFFWSVLFSQPCLDLFSKQKMTFGTNSSFFLETCSVESLKRKNLIKTNFQNSCAKMLNSKLLIQTKPQSKEKIKEKTKQEGILQKMKFKKNLHVYKLSKITDCLIIKSRFLCNKMNYINSTKPFALNAVLSPVQGEVLKSSVSTWFSTAKKNQFLFLTKKDQISFQLPIHYYNHNFETINHFIDGKAIKKKNENFSFIDTILSKKSINQFNLKPKNLLNVPNKKKTNLSRLNWNKHSNQMHWLIKENCNEEINQTKSDLGYFQTSDFHFLGQFVLQGDFLKTKESFYHFFGLPIKNQNSLQDQKKYFSFSHSGQIIHLNQTQITLRRAQPIFFSPQCIFHVYHGNLIQKHSLVLSLPYQRLKTGDIVQGIPKIEQLFEARTTFAGKQEKDSLPNLLKFIFQNYKTKAPFQVAVQKSFQLIQMILVNSIQRIYRSQGVNMADKHIEVIVRQMTNKVKITDAGESGFLRGEEVQLSIVLNSLKIENTNMSSFVKKKIRYKPIILGISKASLQVESFFSAASFQHTTKILSRAAFERKIDFLKGVKENIIIGNLIPAGTGFFIMR